MAESEEEGRRITVRFYDKDLENLAIIQEHNGTRSDSEAIRVALHTQAMLIRDGERSKTG